MDFDIVELDKRIMIYSAWLAETNYETLLLGNNATFSRMALYLGKEKLEDEYKHCKIKQENSLKDGQIVITAQKKGEDE